jgi:IMP dehydrogenase/GMP reductase
LSERKRNRSRGPIDIFGFSEDNFIFGNELEHTKGAVGSGYSMSVTYDEKGKPLVKVKTHGDVDVTELRRDIQQRYPGAKIEGLEKHPLIRVVSEEEKEKQKTEKKPKEEKKEKKKPLIRIIE